VYEDTTTDGQTHDMADVWFAKQADAAALPKLDELVAAAPEHPVLPSAPAAASDSASADRQAMADAANAEAAAAPVASHTASVGHFDQVWHLI
jgi:hypothetical protein